MKLRTWLLLSYFVVMIIPLIAAYFLFAWINAYNEDQKVVEHFEIAERLDRIKTVLNDPLIYKPKAERKNVKQLVTEQISIVLYNPDGLIVYASEPSNTFNISGTSKKELYEDLYTVEHGYSTYNYKQPVFKENEIVGFFKVEIAREAWVGGVSDRSTLTVGIFISLFILIYLLIILIVNKKLRGLTDIMDEMTAFADGHTLVKTRTGKDEIGQLKKHFYEMRAQVNTAREVIEAEQRKKEYMIASLSHDLKTPLTSIKAYAESLDNGHELSAIEQKEYRKVILEKADFMKQMLDDLLTYTLLQSPTYKMEFVDVEGNEFFDMLISGYEPMCKEKDIQLHEHSFVNGSYKVNPKQMMRVADNLTSNAIQHTNKSGNIWIAAISEKGNLPDWLFDFVSREMELISDDHVYFIVQNEGEGIAVDKMDQLFDPLYQADMARSKRDDFGTGLGLSITKQIIEKHGGQIWLYSEMGVGTCVVCRLAKIEGVGE